MSLVRCSGSPRVSSLTYRQSGSFVSSESSGEPEPLYRIQALQRWSIARMQLARATQAYLSACAVIESECTRRSVSFADKCALENTLVKVDTELASLAMDEQRLWRARTTLKRLRNKSSMLAPVNLLPLEILTDIFVMAVEAERAAKAAAALKTPEEGNIIRGRADQATVLASVNVHWRRLAVRTRALWAHVNFGESGAKTDVPFAQAKLWLERARGAPLHILINTTGSAAKVIDGLGVLPLLLSHESHFCSLHLDLNSVDEVHAVLARWLNEGDPNSLRTLAICVPYHLNHTDTPHALPLGLLSREQSRAFFEPIRSLGLDGTYLSWDGASFRGLVNLRLSRLTDRICPNVDQFVTILSSSPALRTLSLHRMTIQPGTRMNFIPVVLHHLSSLELEHIEPRGLCLLLPLLAPQPALNMRITTYSLGPENVGETLLDFFARVRVEKLHLSVPVNPALLTRMIARLGGLKMLVWQRLDIGYEFFDTMRRTYLPATSLFPNGNTPGDSDANGALGDAISACPKLESLEFQQCRFSAAAMRDMVTARTISRLVIVGCHLFMSGEVLEAPKLMEKLEKRLNDLVPDLLFLRNNLIIQRILVLRH